MANERDYPAWICNECGSKYGRRPVGVATWHQGECGICHGHTAVTEPRDFGGLHEGWGKEHADD